MIKICDSDEREKSSTEQITQKINDPSEVARGARIEGVSETMTNSVPTAREDAYVIFNESALWSSILDQKCSKIQQS